MPKWGWSKKRERQYAKVKESVQDTGKSEEAAEEIAARTVNKERARKGEAEDVSQTSVKDKAPGERGGKRSHQGPQGRTKAQLYEEAKRKNVEGRASMTKAELEEALSRDS